MVVTPGLCPLPRLRYTSWRFRWLGEHRRGAQAMMPLSLFNRRTQVGACLEAVSTLM